MTDQPQQQSPGAIRRVIQQNQAPFLYSDMVMDVAMGVHVTKLVFGMETGPGVSTPNLVVGVPTEALLSFALNLIDKFADAAPELQKRHANFASMMETYKSTLDPINKQIEKAFAEYNEVASTPPEVST